MATLDSISVTARCHCSLFKKTVNVPSSAFPLKSALCQCNACRRSTGHLFATFAVIPLPLPQHDFLNDLAKYESSARLRRYFCPRCGASICNVEDEEWEFCTGVLEVEGGLKGKLDRALLFIGDPGDGGATRWINRGQTEGLKYRKMGHRDSQDVTDGMLAAFEKLAESKTVSEPHRLRGSCHCESVNIQIDKPDDREGKYGAGLCSCTSCSKTSGFEITSWLFLPRGRILSADGASLESMLGKLSKYSSSPGVQRYFCNKCGATVLYDKEDRDTIDVAVGLLDAREGARAQAWLHWNKDKDDVAFAEDALDTEFVSRLADGIRHSTSAATEGSKSFS